MDLANAQKDSVRQFWKTNGEILKTIKSVDEIYNKYVTTLKEINPLLIPMNRYIFRTMIRKLGYKNGQIVPKKIRPKKNNTIVTLNNNTTSVISTHEATNI